MSKKNMIVEMSATEHFFYKGTVEIVGDPSQEALDALPRELYCEVSGGFESDEDWERGPSDLYEAEEDDDPAEVRATWTGRKWLIEEL